MLSALYDCFISFFRLTRVTYVDYFLEALHSNDMAFLLTTVFAPSSSEFYLLHETSYVQRERIKIETELKIYPSPNTTPLSHSNTQTQASPLHLPPLRPQHHPKLNDT